MEIDSDVESLISSSDDEFESSSSESEDDCLVGARDWCRLNVSLQPPPPPPPKFPFTGDPGIKVFVSDSGDPLEFFQLFFDDEILDFIVQETNRYAEDFFGSTDLTPSSRALNWKDTDRREIKKFLAILLLQGMVQKPVERWFWSKRPILSTPIFGQIMTEKRYSLLMKFLHFENNEAFNSSTHPNAKLRKIYDLQNRLVSRFKTVYVPERNISIDESLMAYKGQLGWKQYIPSKRARFGIKFYQLCESQTGYVWNSTVYTGKGTTFQTEYEEYGTATKSVMTLIHELLGQGYSLTTDNFFSSPELAELLIREKTDLCGTLRSNRRDLPAEIRNEKLKKGDVIAFQRGKICVLKWKDKKDVCMLSTTHNASMVSVTSKKNKSMKLKPSMIVDYNNNMGGVDKSDQCLSYYPVMRNKQRKYYKKIFRFLLSQTVWNAFLLYKKKCGLLSHVDFRMRLIERLLEASGPNETALLRRNPGKVSENVVRMTGRHFPTYVPVPENKHRKRSPSRTCVVCGLLRNVNGKRVRKETRFECADCNVGLCAAPCFKIYHTVLEL